MLREVLDEVLERLVGHLRLVGPGGIAEDAGEALGIGRLDGAEGVEQRPAHVAGGSAHIGPVRAVRDGKPVVGGRAGIGLVAGLGQRDLVFLVPHIGEPFEEEQRKDVLLVVAGIDQPPEQLGRAPEVGFEFLL